MKKFLLPGFCVKLIPALVAGMLVYSCTDDKPLTTKVDFDREAMLTNWIDNIMLPAFSEFDQRSADLKTTANAYYQQSANLSDLQKDFDEAYIAFQQIKAFEAGPSENISLRASLNTYPADTAKISANIQKEITSVGTASNLTARGFPALDYLLYSNAHNLQDEKVKNYITLLVNDIADMAAKADTEWQAYRSAFINASGTDMGSSLGQMVNAINKDYELIKNAKVGFPAGKKTLGKTYPNACEAFYSGKSLQLAEANIKAISGFFVGKHFGDSQIGPSLKDFLIALGATTDNGNLDEVIGQQFDIALVAVNNIEGPLSEAVDNDGDAVDEAYLAIQQNVRYLKVDMPSAMGVLITYQDNDGD